MPAVKILTTDCSATGDRLCDITEPGGYCTVFNCEPDSCPDDSACVNFGASLSALTDGASNQIVPGCTSSQGNSPYERSFCMAACESDADCRGGYKCLGVGELGGVEVDNTRSTRVCAVPRSGTVPTLNDAGTNDQVCLGSDAGPVPASSTGAGGSGGDAGGGAGQAVGGTAGADNAGAGG